MRIQLAEVLGTEPFQMFTWLRGVGTGLFLCGMLPLVWFVVSRWFSLKAAQSRDEQFVVPPSVLAVAPASVALNGNGQAGAHQELVEPEV